MTFIQMLSHAVEHGSETKYVCSNPSFAYDYAQFRSLYDSDELYLQGIKIYNSKHKAYTVIKVTYNRLNTDEWEVRV